MNRTLKSVIDMREQATKDTMRVTVVLLGDLVRALEIANALRWIRGAN